MNADVIDSIIKYCKTDMRYCESGNLRHVGGKESALETYRAIIKKLEDMKGQP